MSIWFTVDIDFFKGKRGKFQSFSNIFVCVFQVLITLHFIKIIYFRWKGLEDSLDECIDENVRRVDQMCFSSQFYLMVVMQMNGIIYVVLGKRIVYNYYFIEYLKFKKVQ